jgi:hypothetical protein
MTTMTDPTTVTAHGLSGGTLHAENIADGGDYVVRVAPIEGENSVVVLSRDALREFARDVLRMTEPPAALAAYDKALKNLSTDELEIMWGYFDARSKDGIRDSVDRQASQASRDDIERELRRRGIPVPTR